MERETRRSPLLEGVVTFEGTMGALRAEKRIKGEGIACRLIPTPRELSSTCALALAFGHADRDRVGGAIRDHDLRFESVYLYPEDGGEPLTWEP